ncbi:hypothetical protein LCER1_G005373 [Lachnellula cervina]|uniref:Uncharacterized protein n=1 Tax=Lachnellula cervina TaxID=1316786 RepID=A0A7D8YLU1_9HELO|nr:hypothetical protein LCER1_G005373 [Lachnellula cervina]
MSSVLKGMVDGGGSGDVLGNEGLGGDAVMDGEVEEGRGTQAEGALAVPEPAGGGGGGGGGHRQDADADADIDMSDATTVAGTTNDNDSAIGGVGSYATSTYTLGSSFLGEIVEENGRTYHVYKDGKYMLPNDEVSFYSFILK